MKHVCCGGKGGVVRACMHVRAFWCAIYLTEHVLYRAIYLHRTCSIQSKFYIHTDASPLQHAGRRRERRRGQGQARWPYIYNVHGTRSIQNVFYMSTADASPLQHEGESGAEDKTEQESHISTQNTFYTEHVLYVYNTKESAAPRTRPSEIAKLPLSITFSARRHHS